MRNERHFSPLRRAAYRSNGEEAIEHNGKANDAGTDRQTDGQTDILANSCENVIADVASL